MYICIYIYIYIYIYIPEIDIPSETTFRSNWCIGISFIFLICEVYGTNYLSPDVCQIWIKALVRNYRMYRKCFWLEKLTSVTYHNILCPNQHHICISSYLHPSSHSSFLIFGGYNTILCSIITIAILWQLDNDSMETDWY